MVRLKDQQNEKTSPVDAEFQFQYGSIKRTVFRLLHVPDRNFNSNMVRLKENRNLPLILRDE